MTNFAHPKQPYDRSPHYGYAPKSMDHVKPGGWIEVVVGQGFKYVDHNARNVVFAIVLGFSYTGTIYAVVADETQYPDLTGIENGDVLELELAEIVKSEFSPAQQEVEFACEMQAIEIDLLGRHRDEFNRRYLEYSDDALCSVLPVFAGTARQEWLARWNAARKEFIGLLIAERRA